MGKTARGGKSKKGGEAPQKATKEKGNSLKTKSSKSDKTGKISKTKSDRGASSLGPLAAGRGGTASQRGSAAGSTAVSSSLRGRGASSGRGGRGGSSRGGRGSIRGRGGRYASPPRVPLIVPVLPPLYPPVAYLKPLDSTFRHLIPRYKYIKQYMRSNYRVKIERKHPSPFHVEKYTDSYAEPLRRPEHLQHHLDDELIPPGLTEKGAPKAERVEISDQEITRRLEMRARREKENNEIEMSDNEEDSDGEKKLKRKKLDDDEDDDDDEDNEDKESKADEQEDPDEELDEGNDYLLSYFDNGEGNSDEDIDDPNVY